MTRRRTTVLLPTAALLLLTACGGGSSGTSTTPAAPATGAPRDDRPVRTGGTLTLALAEDPDALVLGCDSVLELDGQVYGKPADAEVATQRWRLMRGGSGTLHTGHWVVDNRDRGSGATLGATASTVVHFADLSDAEIEAYVATGEPLAVAGGFTLDGFGGAFVSGVTGDPHNVVGISLPLLRLMLDELGFVWTDFWTT